MTDHSCQFAVATRFYAKNAKAAICIMKSHPFNQTG